MRWLHFAIVDPITDVETHRGSEDDSLPLVARRVRLRMDKYRSAVALPPIGRRCFIGAVAASLSLVSARAVLAESQAPRELPRPDPAAFQTGDFVWPKKPGAYIPYHSGSSNSVVQDREQWLEERDAYIQRAAAMSQGDPLVQQRIATLRDLEYREFLAVYEGAQQPGVPGAYSGGSVYVGHVGIVEVDRNKTAWIIEALLGKGVVRKTYADWITERSDHVVWLGRLRELDAEQRAKIATEARRYLGRPYDFWNFGLNDDEGFYCSKLVWLSIFRALRFAVDGQPNPNRVFWFSPKQLLYLPTIARIHDPGPYASE
jgi:hypothetical protein